MFIVLIHFTKPFAEVDPHVAAHRAHLDEGYQQNLFIVSGPMVPRTGGVLVSQTEDRACLEAFLAADPYHLHQLADYEVIEFAAVKFHEKISSLIA